MSVTVELVYSATAGAATAAAATTAVENFILAIVGVFDTKI